MRGCPYNSDTRRKLDAPEEMIYLIRSTKNLSSKRWNGGTTRRRQGGAAVGSDVFPRKVRRNWGFKTWWTDGVCMDWTNRGRLSKNWFKNSFSSFFSVDPKNVDVDRSYTKVSDFISFIILRDSCLNPECIHTYNTPLSSNLQFYYLNHTETLWKNFNYPSHLLRLTSIIIPLSNRRHTINLGTESCFVVSSLLDRYLVSLSRRTPYVTPYMVPFNSLSSLNISLDHWLSYISMFLPFSQKL